MSENQLNLWNAINDFEFDDNIASLTFSDRLSRENGWSHEFALRAIHEYKKFMFLICVTNQPLTPSDYVDQVWHLHLIYTYSYWKEFCQGILKTEVHHGPTKGGLKERTKFTDWYSKTLENYKVHFNAEPPSDIWPSKETRFKEVNFRWVDANLYWIVKKPFA